MNNANDGSFGTGLEKVQLIIFYLANLISYAYLLYICYRNHILKFNKKTTVALVIGVVVFFYLVLVSSLTDYSKIILVNDKPPISLYNRIVSIMDTSLMCLFVFTIFTCLPNLEERDLIMRFFSFGLLIFAFSAIVYSLATEIEVYQTMITSNGFFMKTENYAYSFFTYGNVYGHLLFFGFLCILYLGYSYKKWWIYLIGIAFGFLIIYSGCRGGFICYLFTCLLLFSYFIYWLWSKKPVLGYISLALVILVFTWFILEIFVIRAIRVPNKVYDEQSDSYTIIYMDLYYIFEKLCSDYLRCRNIITTTLLSFISTRNIIFGLGIDNLDYLVRICRGDFNLHNGLYTIYFTGGIFFALVYIFVFIIVLLKVFKILKFDERYFILYIVFLLPSILYQFSESYPAMFPVFGGGVMGMLLIASVNLKYQQNEEKVKITRFI